MTIVIIRVKLNGAVKRAKARKLSKFVLSNLLAEFVKKKVSFQVRFQNLTRHHNR